VIDLCTREVVGWSMAQHMRTSLVIDAVRMAHAAGRVEAARSSTPIADRNTRRRSSATS
jgi:transposase InsO family protein